MNLVDTARRAADGIAAEAGTDRTPHWAKVVDNERCIGCHACTTACKSENEVPLSVTRTYVKYVDVGTFPQARRAFQVTRCNQCSDAPCTHACPTRAMYARPDGIVDFDKDACIGCKACIAACPYDAIFINPDDHSAEKCNFCAHRLDVGLEPACVVVCPTEALLVGDMNDESSRVSELIHREPVAVRRPEKGTRPKVFYRGAHQATLDPLAAERPKGDLFMWSEQSTGGQHVVSGHPEGGNSSAAAMLAYDVPHKAPWDWKVSLYTLTKGVAAGAYLVPALLVLFGLVPDDSPVWLWAAPIVGGLFLAITGGLLIADLQQPKRFYMIFTRPQWRSWLVRGAFIIAGYSAVLGVHTLASLLGFDGIHKPLALLGVPLAVMTAIYTAYLFAQAKARDLWQSPLLPAHFLVQTLAAGAAALYPVAVFLMLRAFEAPEGLDQAVGLGREGAFLGWSVVGSVLLHLVLVAGEVTLEHATEHAKLATREMTRGRYRRYFLAGIPCVILGAVLAVSAGFVLPDLLEGLVAATLVLAGLLCHEHAYVQAGQSVPLA